MADASPCDRGLRDQPGGRREFPFRPNGPSDAEVPRPLRPNSDVFAARRHRCSFRAFARVRESIEPRTWSRGSGSPTGRTITWPERNANEELEAPSKRFLTSKLLDFERSRNRRHDVPAK